ncbi:ERF family protein [Listeria monocytogenes]|nr:ERF family protein [Listeria monocytogenes]
MKKSESIGAIAKAMVAIQKGIKPLEKSAANPFTDSKYTPLDKIVEAIIGVAPEHGISFTQWPVSGNGGTIGIGTMLMHESGEWIEYDPLYMAVISNKKMSSAQEAGGTITYAKRYAIAAVFGIVSDEDTDGNGHRSTNNYSENNQYKNNNYNYNQGAYNQQTPPAQKQNNNVATPEQRKAIFAKAAQIGKMFGQDATVVLENYEVTDTTSMSKGAASALITRLNTEIEAQKQVQ